MGIDKGEVNRMYCEIKRGVGKLFFLFLGLVSYSKNKPEFDDIFSIGIYLINGYFFCLQPA